MAATRTTSPRSAPPISAAAPRSTTAACRSSVSTHLFLSPELGRYGFPEGHPLSVDRQGAFWRDARSRGLDRKGILREVGVAASPAEIERVHGANHGHPGIE